MRQGIATLALIFAAGPLAACDLCDPNQGAPLSRELAQARSVVYGSIVNARLAANGIDGVSELKIETIIKPDERIKPDGIVTIPRYVPAVQNVKYVVFLDVIKDQVDPYLGLPVTSPNLVKYLKEAPRPDAKAEAAERAKRLTYYFRHLDDAAPEVAADAFKEFATATNLEVGLIAGQLSADKLRAWIEDPKTPEARLSLYSFLLGACGDKDKDAAVLERMIRQPDQRSGRALDGLLAGYIQLRPKDGWQLTLDVLKDSSRKFEQRHAIIRLLRFYYGFQGEQVREPVLRCIGVMLKQLDISDLAVDQLRAWKIWDMTDDVLALYGRKETDSPLARRVITRYALTCPLPQARKFIDELRKSEPTLVKDIEESLCEAAGP